MHEAHRHRGAADDAQLELADDLARPPPAARILVDYVIEEDLARSDERGGGGHRDPIKYESHRVRGAEPGRLEPRGGESDHARQRDGQRAVATVDLSLGDLTVDLGDLVERAGR